MVIPSDWTFRGEFSNIPELRYRIWQQDRSTGNSARFIVETITEAQPIKIFIENKWIEKPNLFLEITGEWELQEFIGNDFSQLMAISYLR